MSSNRASFVLLDPLFVARSLIFNALFYVNITVRMIVALPTHCCCPIRFCSASCARYAQQHLVAAARRLRRRRSNGAGAKSSQGGACIVACKHQSLWETFALFMLLPDPTYVLKRELMWLPLFGWLATQSADDSDRPRRARRRRSPAWRRRRARRSRVAARSSSFRKARGVRPAQSRAICPASLFSMPKSGLPCVPIALNSGLFWPRRSLRRYPGTVLVEVLDPIPPGLERREFLARLQNASRRSDRAARRGGRAISTRPTDC